MINKFTKIAVSFLLIISLIFNPLGSVFDVRADAVILEIAAPIIACLAIGATASLIASVTNELVLTYGDDVEMALLDAKDNFNTFVSDCFQSGNTILISSAYYTDHMNDKVEYYVGEAYVNPDLGLTGTELEIAQAIADGINERVAAGADISLIADKNPVNGALNVNAETYEVLKEIVVEGLTIEYNNYVNDCLGDLTNAFMEEDFDKGVGFYDFKLNRPTNFIKMPTVNGTTTLLRDGFHYSVPAEINLATSQYDSAGNPVLTESLKAVLANELYTYESYGRLYIEGENLYGYTPYIIYDNKIYYNTIGQIKYDSDGSCADLLLLSGFGSLFDSWEKRSKYWSCVDGTTLYDTDMDKTKTIKYGYVLNITGEHASGSPLITSNPVQNEDSFTSVSGGGTVDVPRTDEETLIGNAMGLGLVSPDATIGFGSDGAMTSVDGITLAKLQELCDLMADGNLAFEDMQQYLQVITQLIQTGNFTEAEQITLLENINANVKSIEDVNTSIKQLVDIFNVSNAVVPKPQFVHDNLIGGGFPEAEALIKEALPVVNQAQDLIGNLFNWNDNVQEPPNFSFYWDSNKDGETEKYTVLDLSFMEQTLTNSNLEDKGRFVNPMTIREFVQSLIVLITYAVFAVKIFRKIPGLIGGSESVGDDIRTVYKE